MPPSVVAAFAVTGVFTGLAVRPVVFALSVPTGQPSRRACPHCDRPLLSNKHRTANFVGLLREPCAGCRRRLAPPPASLELLLAGVFALLASRHAEILMVLAFCWLAALGTALALIDLATQRLPNLLTVPTYCGVLGLLTLQALTHHDSPNLLRALLSGLGLAVFYAALAVSTGNMGMGDVKLATSIGTALGWISITTLIAGTLLSLLLAALTGLAAITARRLDWKQGFPFGPFLILGTVITLATNP